MNVLPGHRLYLHVLLPQVGEFECGERCCRSLRQVCNIADARNSQTDNEGSKHQTIPPSTL